MNEMWVIIIMVGVWLAGRFLWKLGGSGKLPRNFNALVKEVQTEENKGRIESAVEWHNKRVAIGADSRASYDRLFREIQRIGGIKKEEKSA